MTALFSRISRLGRRRSSGSAQAALVCSVSTIKDSAENVQWFVTANLAAGVDHMFVFLDGHQPEVAECLRDREEVTVVTTDEGYWREEVPQSLNVRQIVNANVINTALAPFEWASWLVHLDGDEVFHTDRERLLRLDPSVRAATLRPFEAVARWSWEGEVNQFKRLLGPKNLERLVELGLIDEPSNRAYYRGHVLGKPAIRPAFDLDLRIHNAWTPEQEPVETKEGRWLRILHFETPSGEEFVRRWVKAGPNTPRTHTRPRRRERIEAVRSLLAGAELDEERRHQLSRQVFTELFEDDVPTLERLGLLVRHDRANPPHVPVPMSVASRHDLDRWLMELLPMDKRFFQPRETRAHKLAALEELRERLTPDEPHLAARVAAAVGRAGVGNAAEGSPAWRAP